LTASSLRSVNTARTVVGGVAIAFFIACTWASYARWSNFQYRTFDLAYYVQAVWQLIHGRLAVSVENVPLLGNHVEPIVFLFAPLFAVFRHPMLFVWVQNAALAAMAPFGYGIARRLGFDEIRSALLGAVLLVAPAAGYVALHEFHPEALAAPLLLLMWRARLTNSLVSYWAWFVAVLACKENMALLLAAYCALHAVLERKRNTTELLRWYLWPLCLAILWLVVCTQLITPLLNAGQIDYLALYDRLGSSPANILFNTIAHPQLIGHALVQSLGHGNLVWGLLLPFLFLPLLRPRWVLIGGPVLLQHLLSWRTSEWTIYFHYAAPLIPVLWMGMVEALARAGERRSSFFLSRAPCLVLGACIVSQIWLGPASHIVSSTEDWFSCRSDREERNAFLAQIPAQASVVAPLPYLSHLAMREKLYSLHYILKGLKTLSRATYEPPADANFVLIDYLDSATFDPGAGYYHPAMRTADGRVIPSSDRLLHDFLGRSLSLRVKECRNALTLYSEATQTLPDETSAGPAPAGLLQLGTHTQLLRIGKSADSVSPGLELLIDLVWQFQDEREVFPWMLLKLTNQKDGGVTILTKGLCLPEVTNGIRSEHWRVDIPHQVPAGDYVLDALFVNNSRRAWYEATGGGNAEETLLGNPVLLGRLQLLRPDSKQ
jgi:uncharacterized membrane protein